MDFYYNFKNCSNYIYKIKFHLNIYRNGYMPVNSQVS